MNKVNKDNFKQDKYKYGFVTDIESEKGHELLQDPGKSQCIYQNF